MKALLFSPGGRLNRAGYWKGVGLLVVSVIPFMIAVFLLSKIIPGEATANGSYSVHGVAAIPLITLIFGYVSLWFWCGLCLGIKRFHDRGKSGLWVLIQFIPFIGYIWYFVETGFLPGTPGANAYGADPLGGSGLSAAREVF